MSVRLFAMVSLVLPAAVSVAADLASRVDAVTVYPQGAIVTRAATASLSAGSNEIRLVGLVRSVDSQFFQAEIADPGVTIGQIRLETEQEREAYDAEVARIQSEIEGMQRRIQAIDDSTAGAQRRLRFLDGLAEGYAKEAWLEGSRGSAGVDSLRAALELLQSGSEDASTLIRDNAAAKTELEKDLSVLQRTLNDLRGGNLQTVTAALTVSAERAMTTEIRIRYYQADAYWSPVYEARLDSDTGALQLLKQASVRQQTDEDWTNVALTLSTSEPTGDLAAPRLRSQFLDLREPVPVAARARRPSATMAEPAADEAMIEDVMVTAERTGADVGNFAVNYAIPGRTSVLNDSDEAVTLDIAAFNFDTTLVTQVVPRSSTQAFLAARFTHDEPVPLYGSDMRVFVDGVFVGMSFMPTALPRAEVLLPMGQDRRVEVRSESQGGEGGSSGFIGRRRSEVTDFVFEITNRRNRPTYVEVLDRIPVARNRDIDIEVGDDATPPDETDLDDQPGLMRWQKTLAAGEAWRIRHQYTVSYPGDRVLVGQ